MINQKPSSDMVTVFFCIVFCVLFAVYWIVDNTIQSIQVGVVVKQKKTEIMTLPYTTVSEATPLEVLGNFKRADC